MAKFLAKWPSCGQIFFRIWPVKIVKNGSKRPKNGQKWPIFGLFWVFFDEFLVYWPKTHFFSLLIYRKNNYIINKENIWPFGQ